MDRGWVVACRHGSVLGVPCDGCDAEIAMCGRFALDVTGSEIAAAFADGLGAIPGLEIGSAADWSPRWNIAPTQVAPVIRRGGDGGLRLDSLRWGLVPSWSGDPGIGSRMINARSESVHEKPSYREPFRVTRCIVPIRAFYEWTSMGGVKVPHAVRGGDGVLLALAGLWTRADRIPGAEGDGMLESFTILTTAPNASFASIHDRMPVILDDGDRGTWLDHRSESEGGPTPSRLRGMLRACDDRRLRWHPVSNRVNRTSVDEAMLLSKCEAGDGGRQPGLFDS